MRAVQRDLDTSRDLHDASYATAAACARCHPDHAQSFGRTFHRTMTQRASEQSVRGDFQDAGLDYLGVQARATRGNAGEFLIEYAGPGVPRARFVVEKTVGSRRYQQYIAARGGELIRLPIAYHLEEQRWFHMNGAFLTPDPETTDALAAADYERHVTRWNDNCVFCHNVAPNPGKQRGSRGADRFATEVAELGVACEACHGPGREHAQVNANPLRRYALHLSDRHDPSIVNPSRLSAQRSLDVCGRCHGQRITDDVDTFLRHGDPFVPGDDLALYSAPLWRDTTLNGEPAFAARFWADGTPRLTAYEYQGVLLSPCAERGELTCLSCHGMHAGDPRGQLRPDRPGAAQCTQCHTQLSARAAQSEHARHPQAKAQPSCVDCHMPAVVYGVLDVHPSHRIEVPDPARAAAAGRPDGCTLCHVDKTRTWAAAQRQHLWPSGAPERSTRHDEGGTTSSWSEIETLLFAGDPIERALAAHSLGRATVRSARARHAAMLVDVMGRDPYPAVRHLAWRALRALTGEPTLLPEFVPERGPAERARSLLTISERFALTPADAARVPALRAQAEAQAIDIGE